MLWLRKLSVVFTVLALSACGFQPVYQKASHGAQIGSEDLRSIKVAPIGLGRAGQELHTALEDMLNPEQQDVSSDYILNVELVQKNEPLLIERDRSISRYNLVMTGNFTLTSVKTGKLAAKGKSVQVASYDAVTSDFSTYKGQEDAVIRTMHAMAFDIRGKIASYISKIKARKQQQ